MKNIYPAIIIECVNIYLPWNHRKIGNATQSSRNSWNV